MAVLCERWIVSVDIGGTSARGMWCAWPGGPWGRVSLPSQNFRSLTDEALKSWLRDLNAQLPAEFGKGAPVAWLLGAAGAEPLLDGARVGQALAAAGITAARVVVSTDYESNWAAALGGRWGAISVNGTGSVMYGRNANREVRVGGWGFLFDSVPSAAALGRMAGQALLAFWEGEHDFHHFGEVYTERFPEHPRTREGFLRLVYSAASPQRTLGELAPLFVEAHRRGSTWAAQRLEYSLNAWVAQMGRLDQELRNAEPLPWVGLGGLWGHWPLFCELACERLDKRYPGRFCRHEAVCELGWGPLIRDLLHSEENLAANKGVAVHDWRHLLNELRTTAPAAGGPQ